MVDGHLDQIPSISVVIPAYNESAILPATLEALKAAAARYIESGLGRVEVIVVDNASRDGSAAMVAEEFPKALLVRSETNVGFGRANNLGFEVARGRYVVLLNSDAFLAEGALELSVAHMDANPNAGLGGGRLIGRDGSGQPSARMFPKAQKAESNV